MNTHNQLKKELEREKLHQIIETIIITLGIVVFAFLVIGSIVNLVLGY